MGTLDSNQKAFDVVIVGAGIIGCSTAYALAKQGLRVAVLDKGELGQGCSYGNAGWITPCFAMPLPMPGMFWKSFKWLLLPESPLYIKPSLSPDLIGWLWTFMKNMNEAQAARAIRGLVQLSIVSQSIYRDLAKLQPQTNYQQQGLLMITRTEDGIKAAQDEMQRVALHGIPGELLNGSQVKEKEPALKGDFLGGVYFPNEAMVEPFEVVKALAAESKKLGAQFFSGFEFQNLEMKTSAVSGLKAKSVQSGEEIHFTADHVVMATGSWSKSLAAKLDLKIPILGGKGYALIVPKLQQQPVHPIMYVEKKVAITPRTNSLRIAGTLELVDQDFSINTKRLAVMEKGAREVLNLPEQLQIQETWRGLRPCTPDGVPLIGPHHQLKNLWFAAGHQMLGLQAGAGTGELVARMITGKSPEWDRLTQKAEVDEALFSPRRFQ